MNVSIEVRKDHPGLPKLIRAAAAMREFSYTNEAGVTVTKKGNPSSEQVEEFVGALADVVGLAVTEDVILSALSAKIPQEGGVTAAMAAEILSHPLVAALIGARR